MDRLGGITQTDLEYMLHDEDAEPMAMPFPLLEKITDYFSDESIIGRGGYAVVYKAMLDNGIVAVKRLSNTHMNEEIFLREVECLMKAKHKNIVRFLGYCSDTQGKIWDYNGKMVMADVRQRLLCYEYLPKGSFDNYINKDSFGELKWRKRYHIIKGICDGLNYLHQNNILHLDLKPGNILLDEDMMPKITDFGLSRCLKEGQTRVITKNVVGTMGYLAPECYSSEITITHKSDLYSLGVIIMEILTGKKGCENIEDVRESWSYKSDILWWEQIRVCAEIGIECIDLKPANRPQSMKHIIDRLLVEESSTHVVPTGGLNKLLVLHTSALRFTFEANKVITCPLQLTNNTNKHVVFKLMDKSGQSSFLRLPLYGVVPPNNPYTLIVTTQEKELLPRKWIIDVILGSAALILGDDEHIKAFQCQPEKYFQDMWDAVQEVKLKALYTLPCDIITSSSKPISPRIKINFLQIDELSTTYPYCLDTNQAKQWIITGDDRGYVRIWDYKTQRKVDSLKVSATHAIKCIKFIARKQWIVAGTKNTEVHVYNYEKMQKITSFRIAVSVFEELVSLAIHPTQPYLLSVDFYIKLWDWDKNWECIRRFEYQNYLTCPVVFNPNNTFATASGDCTVEIWSFDSPKSNYALSGHSGKVNCLDFFICHDQEFLITGSDDQTAKIWYLKKKICAYTLDAFMSRVTSVLYQPNHQTLIIGSEDGDIYLWSTTNCRIYSCPPTLEGIIKIGCVGAVDQLACLMGRVVIGKGKTVAIMYIHNVNYQERSTDYNKQQVNANKRQRVGDASSKRIAVSISRLLDVYPLELHFPYHPNEPIQCSVHLRNNTDQNVAFRLVDKSGEAPWCFAKLPLYGIVPHRSTYTLIVTTKEEMKLKRNTDFYLVIQNSLLGDKYKLFEDQSESDQFFKEAKEFGNIVDEVKLKVVYLDYEEIPENIPVKYNRDLLCSLDAHPTEPWVLTGHRSGYARIWNHEMKNPMNSFYVSGHAVCYIKFIARRKLIVAVTSDRDLHVYSHSCVKKIEAIMIVRPIETTRYAILAVHPTLPYVVSPGIKLLDWNLGWEDTHRIYSLGFETATLFNPENANSYVSGYYDGEVKVWRLDSFVPEFSLLGHLDSVNCLDFITRGDQQYLITGSDDGTAKIWDLKKRKCISTLEATSPVLCVLARANLPVLITGTKHGIIHVWSSTDFRLERAINLGGGGPIVSLGYLVDSPRVVIGQGNTFSSMDKLGNFIGFKQALCAKRRSAWLAVLAATRFLRLRTSEKHRLGTPAVMSLVFKQALHAKRRSPWLAVLAATRFLRLRTSEKHRLGTPAVMSLGFKQALRAKRRSPWLAVLAATRFLRLRTLEKHRLGTPAVMSLGFKQALRAKRCSPWLAVLAATRFLRLRTLEKHRLGTLAVCAPSLSEG